MVNQKKTQESVPLEVDIAIVGAGPAGLYAAWRLLKDPKFALKKIVIFDAADRTGGRVLSLRIPGFGNVLELGAMRYLSDQIILASLIKELKLEKCRFEYDAKGYFLRGRFIGPDDFKKKRDPVEGLYNISEDEKGKNPIELIIVAIQRAMQKMSIRDAADKPDAQDISISDLQEKLKTLDQNTPLKNLVKGIPGEYEHPYFSADEWHVIKRYGRIDDEPLKDYGFWDLVQSNLSIEGYNLAHEGSGYQSILNMWNAADAIIWYLADFTDVPYCTLKGGMGELINKLTTEISQLTGQQNRPSEGSCKVCWSLKKICNAPSGSRHNFALHFKVNEFCSSNRVEDAVAVANTVILALPQPALKEIDCRKIRSTAKAADSARFPRLLDAVDANPLCKIFAVFEKSWWEDRTQPPENLPSSFKLLTDLPLRMLYQFGRKHCWFDENESNKDACVLLAYSDARYAEYWKNLDQVFPNDHSYYKEIVHHWMSDKDWKTFRREKLNRYGISEAVVKRFVTQLRQIANLGVPMPCAVFLKSWSSPPAYVGWHSWKMGQRSWEVSEEMIQPFGGDIPIFTCGEAFSGEQGWIEGALKSSERMLGRLGAATPQWIDREIYEQQKKLWI